MIGAHDLNRIVFGCGNIGGLGSSPSLRDKGDSRPLGLALLDHARALGLTRFDTANTYGGGISEQVLGEWLARQDSGFRARIQVATKVGNPNGTASGRTPLGRREVAEHLDRSLQRLGLDRIDLYYIHEFDHVTPLDETLEAFDRALAAGKIARVGISNAALADIEAVLTLAGGGSLRAAFTTVQNEFNLLRQGDLEAVIPLCAAEGLQYVAFSPLAGGLLSGKYRMGATAEAGTRAGDAPQFVADLMTAENFAAIEALRVRAQAHGWPLPVAALRFILDAPGALSLIVAPRSIEQFDAYGIVPA
jgi:aryl-alcohol dehydrogenase-like predicted oxidoreductase